MKTDEELRQIALDLHLGKIFSDRHCPGPESIPMVFMLLNLMEDKVIEEIKAKNVNFIYEYLDQAGPLSVNGMPTFMSLRFLTKDESDKMFEYYKKFKEAQDSVKA